LAFATWCACCQIAKNHHDEYDNFLTKTMQTASLQSKGQKQGGLGTWVEVLEQGQNVQQTASIKGGKGVLAGLVFWLPEIICRIPTAFTL